VQAPKTTQKKSFRKLSACHTSLSRGSLIRLDELSFSQHISRHIGDMGSKDLTVEHLAVGANRQTAVADWSRTGLLAYGADCNIALWRPAVSFHVYYEIMASSVSFASSLETYF
jgi:hypothetical protein